MLAAVHLNDKPDFWCIEIDNVIADGPLTKEFYPYYLSHTQVLL
jgi:hypothetical protein